MPAINALEARFSDCPLFGEKLRMTDMDFPLARKERVAQFLLSAGRNVIALYQQKTVIALGFCKVSTTLPAPTVRTYGYTDGKLFAEDITRNFYTETLKLLNTKHVIAIDFNCSFKLKKVHTYNVHQCTSLAILTNKNKFFRLGFLV